MRHTSELFELIRSLSRSEKGYFKKYSQLHTIGKQNKYIVLFDAIDRQKEYNESALISRFKGKAFATQFSAAKNYLYKQILSAMRLYNSSTHSELHDQFQNADFLCDKGLYSQSLKAVNKAKHIAKENEMHGFMLEISRHLVARLGFQMKDKQWRTHMQQEKRKELFFLQNSETYEELICKLYEHYRSYGVAREKKHLQAFENVMKNAALSDESKAITVAAKMRFNDIHALYGYIMGDHKSTYVHIADIVRLFQEHPQMKKVKLFFYIAYLNNICENDICEKKYSNVPQYLNELQALASNKKLDSRLFTFYKSNLLFFLSQTGQFTEAKALLPEIIQQINQFENKLTELNKTDLFAFLAMVYFGNGQYNKSIFWLNRIWNEAALNIRPDIESTLRSFSLIVHYEAGHQGILPYQIQSTYRFLCKKQLLYKFEAIVIDYLRNKFRKANSAKELLSVFKKFRTEIAPLATDPHEKSVFRYFDYISWLESKIEKRSYAEIVREKADVSYGERPKQRE